MIKNKAGNPPNTDICFTPSIPALAIMVQERIPIINPQMIFMVKGDSGFSGEIPTLDIELMAEVFESAAVT